MDSIGRFHEVEIDGKPYLVYHQPEYQLPQIDTQTSSSSDEAAMDSGGNDHPLFLCPKARLYSHGNETEEEMEQVLHFQFTKSPHFEDNKDRYNHYLLPLYWCNNKESDPCYKCSACGVQSIGTDHYYCVECDQKYHKECVESPLRINYPSHLKHTFRLFYFAYERDLYCICCKEIAGGIVYSCDTCNTFMHVLCATARIPFFLDQPKRHHHTLTLFPRQASLTCNVCGLINKIHFTYVCPRCDFVSHCDCLHIPNTIKISRHHHRIHFTSSLLPGKWSCGVCRQEVDNDYGAYTCNMCSDDYVVHVRCALRKDVWDGEDLDGVPEFDEDEDVEPFEMIADGIIHHFSHDHHLRLEISRVYNDHKFCQACVMPIYEGGFYTCVDHCNFILHETCANSLRKKQHPLHPQPLTLTAVSNEEGLFNCDACKSPNGGFAYEYLTPLFGFRLDIRCAAVSEPFEYQGHIHPLFLSLEPGESPICHVCKTENYQKVLNCIECDFILCFKCATLPYMARYKHDQHYLKFCHGDEASDSDWCELCEGKLAIGGKEGFYKCDQYCCTTLHINCLLGSEPYLKHGQTLKLKEDEEVCIIGNHSASRPICSVCHRRCQYQNILDVNKTVFCSLECILPYLMRNF